MSSSPILVRRFLSGDYTSILDTPSSSARSTPSILDATIVCRWEGCTFEVPTGHHNEFISHVNTTHVVSGATCCKWVGCKVFEVPAASSQWLGKHMTSHTGEKPFKCVLLECGQSFSSQEGLAKHVNNHFETSVNSGEDSNGATSTPKKSECSNQRESRNKRRLRTYCTAPYYHETLPPRFIDTLAQRMVSLTKIHGLDIEDAHQVLFKREPRGCKRNVPGCETSILTGFLPSGMLADEWIPEAEFSKYQFKKVSLSAIDYKILSACDKLLGNTIRLRAVKLRGKSKRPPISS